MAGGGEEDTAFYDLLECGTLVVGGIRSDSCLGEDGAELVDEVIGEQLFGNALHEGVEDCTATVIAFVK